MVQNWDSPEANRPCIRADLFELQQSIEHALRVEIHAVAIAVINQVHADISKVLNELHKGPGHSAQEKTQHHAHFRNPNSPRPNTASHLSPCSPVGAPTGFNQLSSPRFVGAPNGVNQLSSPRPVDEANPSNGLGAAIQFELLRQANSLRYAAVAADIEAKPPDLQAATETGSMREDRPLSNTSLSTSTNSPSPSTRPVSGASQVSAGSLRRHSSLRLAMEDNGNSPIRSAISKRLAEVNEVPDDETESQEPSSGPEDILAFRKMNTNAAAAVRVGELEQEAVRSRKRGFQARKNKNKLRSELEPKAPPSLLTSEVSHKTKVHPPFGAPPPLPPLPNSPLELPGIDPSAEVDEAEDLPGPLRHTEYGMTGEVDSEIIVTETGERRSTFWKAAASNISDVRKPKALRFDSRASEMHQKDDSAVEENDVRETILSQDEASQAIATSFGSVRSTSKIGHMTSTSRGIVPMKRFLPSAFARASRGSRSSARYVAAMGTFRQRPLKAIVETDIFDYLMGLVLCLNAASIGWEVDYKASHINKETPVYFKVIEVSFCVIFSVEAGMRMLAYKLAFFYRKDWQWNVFDLIIVGLQIVEIITNASVTDSEEGTFDGLSFLKILKFGRVVRLVRMVRLIPSLKSMVYLIAASLGSFFWTIMLLMLLIYGVAIYFTDVVTDYQKAKKQEAKQGVIDSWGALSSSIISLYEAILGGVDWHDLFDPLNKEVNSPLAVILFLLYIAFATLVMLNLVTGVFVEGAQRIIRQDKDAELVKNVKKLFARADKNDEAEITWAEFQTRMDTDDARLDEYFKAVDLNKAEARNLFKLLDHDNSGSLSADEFVHGCLRLKGPAKSVDLATLLFNSTKTEDRWAQHFAKIELKLERLSCNLAGDPEGGNVVLRGSTGSARERSAVRSELPR